jgi:hypothetical protein
MPCHIAPWSFPRRRPSRIAVALADDRLLSRAAVLGCEHLWPLRGERRQAGRRCSRGYEFFPVDGTPGTTGASGPVHNGVTIIKPLAATAWGTKDFYIDDPDGYIICFGGRPAAG